MRPELVDIFRVALEAGGIVGLDGSAAVALSDGINLDAFNRLRVSQNNILLSAIQHYDKLPLIYDEALTATGTATHLPNESSTRMRVAATGDKVIRQTKEYFPYRTGNSQLVLCTFVAGAHVTGVRQRVGYFDASNGIFVERSTAGVISMVIRTFTSGAAADGAIVQASWNLDVMDGTGPSGITLDFAKSQILVIDLQWLGVGRVRVGFDIGGIIVYVHQFAAHANVLSTVYMSRATLPVRYEIESVAGGAVNVDLIQICASVIREGGLTDPAVKRSVNNGITSVATSTANFLSILSIRKASTFIRGRIRAAGLQVFNTDATNGVVWGLFLNPTLGGALTYGTAGTSSMAEVSVTGQTVTAGILIDSGYVGAATAGRGTLASSPDSPSTLPLGATIAGVSDVYVLAVKALSGTPNVLCSLDFEELK